jgi:hypothetical protein
MLVVPTTQEAGAGGSLDPKSWVPTWPTQFCLKKQTNKKTQQQQPKRKTPHRIYKNEFVPLKISSDSVVAFILTL